MDLRGTVQRHLDAWQSGDPERVAGAVASFADPDTPEPVSDDALRGHAGEVFARCGDLTLDVDRVDVAADTAVAAWTLRAIHRQPYLGIPATGGAVTVQGVDVLTVRDGQVHARRTFDRLALASSLGVQARFTPPSDGVRDFGVSSRTGSRNAAAPGALVLTWLDVRDEAESADVDLLSVEVIKSLRASRGFLGTSTFDIGTRKYTLTAFDQPDSIRAVHAKPHQRALRRFFNSGLCTDSWTSVWAPIRSSRHARCPDCEAVVAVTDDTSCDCGWSPSPHSLF